MMKYISTLVRAAAASLVLAGATSAATFDINTAPVGLGGSGAVASCSSFPSDTTCNFTIGLAPSITTSFGLDSVTPSRTFNFLQFTATGSDAFFPDNAVINASLVFNTPSSTIGIGGTGSNIRVLNTILFGSVFTSTSLIWSSPVSQFISGVGTVTVELQNVVFGVLGTRRSFIVDATVTLQPIPLPAGILLLGSALLGIFGLSRRRKLASA